MAKKASKTRVIVIAVVTVLLLAVIGLGVWFILDRTNGGTEAFQTFTVTLDGKEIKSTSQKKEIICGKHTGKVKYIFSSFTGKKDYDVSIIPRSGVAFDFYVNDTPLNWRTQKLTAAFGLVKGEDTFTFTVPTNLSAVLAALYPGAEITAPKEDELPDPFLYTLVVSSYDRSLTYTIDFAVTFSVTTDKDHVEFP